MSHRYVDTSALLKWYVRELGSRTMTKEREKGGTWFTSRLTTAEGISALNRLRREGVLTVRDADGAITRMREELEQLHVVDVGPVVLGRADVWARQESLRGCDLVHASTALWLRDEGLVDGFWCADKRLANAVAMLGMDVVNPEELEARG